MPATEKSRLKGREVVIVDAARTPIGRGHPTKGVFREIHPNALLGAAYTAVIERAGIEPELVEDVVAQYGHSSFPMNVPFLVRATPQPGQN